MVEIHAGYTDYRMTTELDADKLESNLNLLFIGHPYYVAAQKIPGGRYLDVKLSDIVPANKAVKFVKTFNKNSLLVGTILPDMLKTAGVKFDLSKLQASQMSSIKIETDLFYNGEYILQTILPKLSKQYGFYYNTNNAGALVFSPSGIQKKGAVLSEVTIDNGLVEYPTQINNTQYSFKTFFGAPGVFSPGDYVKIVSSQFSTGSATGLIIDGSYSWQDDKAEIIYKFGGDGKPVEVNPVFN